MGKFPQGLGDKNGLVTSVDWKHRTRIEKYLCLRFHTHAVQVGFCISNNRLYSCVYICVKIKKIPDCIIFSAG
jgi:hypothetical protein